MRELRAISFVQRMLSDGTIDQCHMNRVLIHMIADDDLMNDLSVATKTVPNPVVLDQLKQAGRAAAHSFLADHKADINVESTVDLAEMFS